MPLPGTHGTEVTKVTKGRCFQASRLGPLLYVDQRVSINLAYLANLIWAPDETPVDRSRNTHAVTSCNNGSSASHTHPQCDHVIREGGREGMHREGGRRGGGWERERERGRKGEDTCITPSPASISHPSMCSEINPLCRI